MVPPRRDAPPGSLYTAGASLVGEGASATSTVVGLFPTVICSETFCSTELRAGASLVGEGALASFSVVGSSPTAKCSWLLRSTELRVGTTALCEGALSG